MSGDPAVEAARRVWKGCDLPDCGTHNRIPSELVSAAREALAPLRDLHKPFTRDYVGGDGRTVCLHCLGPVNWPCGTALWVYSSEELS